jgi:hypothetical protein
MAFSASQFLIELGFDLTNSPKDFTLTDNTVYTGETYTNVLGNLRALDPSGSQFYNNTSYSTPDITLSVSNTSATLGSLPLNTDGTVKEGLYTFVYTAKITDLLQKYTIVSNDSPGKTFTVTGNISVDILSSTAANWECVDSSTTALTIVSATYNSGTNLTTVTINETLGTLTALAQLQFTMDQVFTKTFTQDYSYSTPSICLNWVSDECCSSMTITDVTVYESNTTVTRLHTVSYPTGISPTKSDITSPLQELTITPIWTGTWVDIFTADIEATNGIITIIDSARGVKEHKVSADEGLCQVYACMAALSDKYSTYLTSAPQKALEMQKYITQASAAYMAYTIGKKCGETDYEQYLTTITDIATQCDCGCGCTDCSSTPTQVVGCCENVGGSDYTIVITSNNGSLTVTSNTVGTTTTFNIEVTDAWLTTQIQNEIAVTDINDLADVDTTNLTGSSGQILIWNQGTGKWERGSAQLNLVQLLDVDDTGLANNMVMYYDAGSTSFKFKLSAAASIATLSDVTLTTLASGQILKYNGTAWVNVNNYLSLMGDVNVTGLASGQALKWDSGTSKWIVYSPVDTFAGLTDVSLTSLADKDRVWYVTGSGWVNSARPTFIALVSYQSGFSGAGGVFFDAGASYDVLTNMVTLRGVIDNSNTAITTSGGVTIATLPSGYRPDREIAITIQVGLNAVSFTALAGIDSSGVLKIYKYYDSTGDLTDGVPVGDICLDNISFCPTA